MKVLVAGASGYIGARLIPRVVAAGHDIRAGFTDPSAAGRFFWAQAAHVVRLDVTDDSLVAEAVQGCDAVVYLVHGMGGDDFAAKDRQGAQILARAAVAAGVGRIVYLSGLVPDVEQDELSEHIASRLEVEQILGSTGVTTITLRAAVVTGSGSTSFEIIRQISERMPVQAIPTWMNSTVQPIAVSDVVEALLGALSVDSGTRSYDIGGPEAMPYAELLTIYAEVAGISRPQVEVPGLPTELVGKAAGLITDVPAPTVEALIESLHHDMVCQERDFIADLLPAGYRLVPVRESFERSLAETSSDNPAGRDPLGPMPHDPDWAGGTGGGVAAAVAGLGAVASGIAAALSPNQR